MAESQDGGAVGFVGLLQIVFIVLKLIGKIDWSWWWVLSPIWGSFLLALFVLGMVVAVISREK